jgi:hypothetical protein
MMKTRNSLVVALGMLVSASSYAQSDDEPIANVRTVLSAAQEVAVVNTTTTGAVRLIFDAALTEIRYALTVNNGISVVAAHLHCARAGADGPVAVTLFSANPSVDADGVLQLGVITNADVSTVTCAVNDMVNVTVNNIASLFQAAKDGLIYANVHSENNPSGVVRGQVFP